MAKPYRVTYTDLFTGIKSEPFALSLLLIHYPWVGKMYTRRYILGQLRKWGFCHIMPDIDDVQRGILRLEKNL